VPSRKQVRELVDGGHSYETAARQLGIPVGLAYMIATGKPAAGSEVDAGPPAYDPTGNEHVLAWVRERAARELKRAG